LTSARNLRPRAQSHPIPIALKNARIIGQSRSEGVNGWDSNKRLTHQTVSFSLLSEACIFDSALQVTARHIDPPAGAASSCSTVTAERSSRKIERRLSLSSGGEPAQTAISFALLPSHHGYGMIERFGRLGADLNMTCLRATF
jgi:hypothetical protein